MPSTQAFSSSAPARLIPQGLSPSSPDVEFLCGKRAPYHPSDELFTTGTFSAYATISIMTGDGNCGFRAIAKGVYGDESFYKTVRQEMAKQLLYSTPSIYPAEANRTLSSLLLAITGPKEGTMCDSSHWFNDLSHAGIAADAFGCNLLIAARGSSRMQVFLPLGTIWAPGAESAPNVGLLFNGVNHWDAFTLDVRADAVVTKLFDMEWVTVQRR